MKNNKIEQKTNIEQGFTDIYSITHIMGGIILHRFGFNFLHSNLIHLLYEFTDLYYFPYYFKQFKPKKSSYINGIGDQIYCCIGWFISYIIGGSFKFNIKYIWVLFFYPIIASSIFTSLLNLGVFSKF